MRRALVLSFVFAAAIGTGVGCGNSAELAALREKNAELEKTVAARDKEIAGLKAGRDGRPPVEETRVAPPPPGKVFRTPQELFADMPPSAYPQFGRAAARKWIKENVVGRVIEWTATVKEVKVSGDGPFRVILTLDSL